MSRHRTLAKTAAVTVLALAAFVGHRYVLPRVGLAAGPTVPLGSFVRLSASAPSGLIGASVTLAAARMTPVDDSALARLRDRGPTAPIRPSARPSPGSVDALQITPAGAVPCLETACAPRTPANASDPDVTGSITTAGLSDGDENLAAGDQALAVRQARVFTAVAVLDGRSFKAGGATVRLANLALPGSRQQCLRLDGVSEPCAARARTRLDLMTRHRPVTCALEPATPVGDAAPTTTRIGAPADALAGDCRVGSTDLALWLIREGWATPLRDTPEAAAALASARRVRAGIWR